MAQRAHAEESMVTLASSIDAHRDAIMNRWAELAREKAFARGLSQPELRNVLPRFLSALASGSTPDTDAHERVRNLVESHLAGRIRHGFDLAEIVEEFTLLEDSANSVCTTLPEHERPSEGEQRAFSAIIQRTIVLVTDLFEEHMRLDEQHEKRYLRLLQTIADDALRSPGAQSTSPLRAPLELILEAIGADAVCLLLLESTTRRVLAVASAGLAKDELTKFVTGVDSSTLVGSTPVASGEQTLAEIEPVEVTDRGSMREHEIHSLVRLRLPPRHALSGYLYVGLHGNRDFTSRELRRAEALADRLLLHLDNAELYAALRRHIDELDFERDLRERFVAILAHDLRGPLSAAKMSSHLLIRHPESLAERRALAVRLERNLDRMDRMIRDLLDVSRVRAGERLPLRLDSCDLGALAEDVVEELSATHGERFDLVTEAGVRGIWSYDELRRALWNLGVNAVKYGDEVQRIRIRVERARTGARLSVHNYGKPIPQEDQASLFDLYSRLKSGGRSGAGWGLGLALVRACAEAHGGTSEVESSENAGTTFSIVLPLDSRPFQQERPPPSSRGEG